MSADQWRRDRDTLLGVLRDYEFGKIMNFGEDDNGAPTREMIEQRIASVNRRIADLDTKLAQEPKA